MPRLVGYRECGGVIGRLVLNMRVEQFAHLSGLPTDGNQAPALPACVQRGRAAPRTLDPEAWSVCPAMML